MRDNIEEFPYVTLSGVGMYSRILDPPPQSPRLEIFPTLPHIFPNVKSSGKGGKSTCEPCICPLCKAWNMKHAKDMIRNIVGETLVGASPVFDMTTEAINVWGKSSRKFSKFNILKYKQTRYPAHEKISWAS